MHPFIKKSIVDTTKHLPQESWVFNKLLHDMGEPEPLESVLALAQHLASNENSMADIDTKSEFLKALSDDRKEDYSIRLDGVTARVVSAALWIGLSTIIRHERTMENGEREKRESDSE